MGKSIYYLNYLHRFHSARVEVAGAVDKLFASKYLRANLTGIRYCLISYRSMPSLLQPNT